MGKNEKEDSMVFVNDDMATLLKHSQRVNSNIAETVFENEKREAEQKFGLLNPEKRNVDVEAAKPAPSGNRKSKSGPQPVNPSPVAGDGAENAGSGAEGGENGGTGSDASPEVTDPAAPAGDAAPAADGDKKPWEN